MQAEAMTSKAMAARKWICCFLQEARLLFLIMRGWFRPSLAGIVRTRVVAQLRENRISQQYRYRLPRRLVLRIVRHPLLSVLIVAIIYASSLALAEFVRLPQLAPVGDDGASFRDFWTVNVAVLSVQAALVGLVFPLVIAFVGLLNQGRAAYASRLTIYIDVSGAIFVGISSLSLCAILSLQLLLLHKFDTATAAITALNLVWFVVNVAALAHFVLDTIAFLHPERQAPIIRAYLANVVWPRELTEAVTQNRWGHAVEYGYLPDGDELDAFGSSGGARVWYSPLFEGGEPQVRWKPRGKMRLVDVRFGLLAPIVKAWLESARRSEAAHDFVLPLQPGEDYEGEQALVRATLPLTGVGRCGVWAAFRFRKTYEERGAVGSTGTLLREMVADLIALIDGRQADEFDSRLTKVIESHAFLYLLAQIENEDVSYAQFNAGEGVFGPEPTLAESWTHAYRDMIRRAIERIPDEPEFFARTAYLAAHIYGSVGREITPQALRPVFSIADMVSFRLIEWAAKEHRAESTETVTRSFSLVRRGEVYGRAWLNLVAGRERLLTTIVTRSAQREGGERSWDDLRRIAANVLEHLRSTTLLAGRAVWAGDMLAANWSCDLLLHWQGLAEHGWEHRRPWGLRSEVLTTDLLDKDWREAQGEFSHEVDGNRAAPAAVFGCVIQNTWCDHLITLASVCIRWSLLDSTGDTAQRAARMLLRRELHDRGNSGRREGGQFTANDILVSLLRIQGSGERFAEHSYAATIEHLLERLAQLGERSWVSMRIYSLSGGLPFTELSDAHAVALMAQAPRPLEIGGALRRLLTEENDEALRRRQGYLEALLVAFDDLSTGHVQLSASLADDTSFSFEARLGHARHFVAQSLELLHSHRETAVAQAPIDVERLQAVEVAAASRAFMSQEFPLNLFREISPTPDALNEFTLRSNDESKGGYTNPPMAQVAVNLEEWWTKTMADQVASVVWHDVLTASDFASVDGRTPESFWQAVRDGSKRIREVGQTPFLVVSSSTEPRWLEDWAWPDHRDGYAKPSDLVITRKADEPDSYEFSMNNTPVYEAQTTAGVAYLLPAERLRRLRYHIYGNDLPVSVRFEPNISHPKLGTLFVSFQRDVELAETEAFAIRFAAASTPPPPVYE